MSCHFMSRHITSNHVMICHVSSRHVTSRHVTSRHVASRHVTLLIRITFISLRKIDLFIFDYMTMQHQVSLDHTCSARVIRVEGIGYGFGIIFRKNWSWKKRINTAVTHMINGGEVDHFTSKWFSKSQCKKASTFYSLDINRMKDIFILLGITVLVCLLAALTTNVFGWMLVAKRDKTSSRSSQKD